MGWLLRAFARSYAAAIFGGILILLLESREHDRDFNDKEIGRVAARYRQFYGDRVFVAISDH